MVSVQLKSFFHLLFSFYMAALVPRLVQMVVSDLSVFVYQEEIFYQTFSVPFCQNFSSCLDLLFLILLPDGKKIMSLLFS